VLAILKTLNFHSIQNNLDIQYNNKDLNVVFTRFSPSANSAIIRFVAKYNRDIDGRATSNSAISDKKGKKRRIKTESLSFLPRGVSLIASLIYVDYFICEIIFCDVFKYS